MSGGSRGCVHHLAAAAEDLNASATPPIADGENVRVKSAWLMVFVASLCIVAVSPARAVDPLAPPLVTTPAWQTWYDKLLAMRLAECPRERSATFHFAADGDDISGDGSIGNPYRTLAMARAIADANPQGDIALLFRRGDTWRMPTDATADDVALEITAPDVTVADYGTGPKPRFTAFNPIEASTWQPDAANPGLFFTTAAPDTTWVKDGNAPLEPFIQTFSLIECGDRPRSFFYEPVSMRLYVNPPPAHPDPRTGSVAYEATRPTGSGVRMRGDGGRVESISAWGFGMWFTTPSQNHGIDLWVRNADRAVAVECESYYGSSHCIVHAASGASGGITTFSGCEAGLTTPNIPANETVFNAFSQGGGHQVIFDRCIARFGRLPSTRWNYGTTNDARSFFSHAGSAGNPAALAIAMGCSTPGGPYTPARPVAFNSMQEATSLEDVRAFIVDEVFVGGLTSSVTPAQSNVVAFNCQYLNIKPIVTDPTFSTGAPKGFEINSVFQLDLSEHVANSFGLYNPAPNQQSRATFLHCHFDITTRPGLEVRLDFDNPNRSFFATVRNTLFTHRGGGSFVPYRGFVFPTAAGNAYFGATQPDTAFADPTGLALSSDISIGTIPAGTSELAFAATLSGPIRPELDAIGNVGLRTTIGPIDNTIGDVNNDGRFDLDDIYQQTQSPIDVDGNGIIDSDDTRLVVRRARWGERLILNDPASTPSRR